MYKLEFKKEIWCINQLLQLRTKLSLHRFYGRTQVKESLPPKTVRVAIRS